MFCPAPTCLCGVADVMGLGTEGLGSELPLMPK